MNNSKSYGKEAAFPRKVYTVYATPTASTSIKLTH